MPKSSIDSRSSISCSRSSRPGTDVSISALSVSSNVSFSRGILQRVVSASARAMRSAPPARQRAPMFTAIVRS